MIPKEYQYQRARSPPPSGEIKILYFPKYEFDTEPPEEPREAPRRRPLRKKRPSSRVDDLPDEHSSHTAPALTDEGDEDGDESEHYDDAEEAPREEVEGEEKKDKYAYIDKMSEQEAEDRVREMYQNTRIGERLPIENLEGQSPRAQLKRLMRVREAGKTQQMAQDVSFTFAKACEVHYKMDGVTAELMEDQQFRDALYDATLDNEETLEQYNNPILRMILSAGRVAVPYWQRARALAARAAAAAEAAVAPDPAAGVGSLGSLGSR